ncbi:sensor histidine kinase [Piscinibacter sp.]|uniref:sensor histidine kinase n=1 Tax=Piscinibacter sp. TaxID=1903157 RepID=UPI002CE39D6D|nr:histidine kinase [Albitalea sp.]HUG25140.1 histidine kinase [Albitalea sp.]
MPEIRTAGPAPWQAPGSAQRRLVGAQLAFLRFAAGMRALFALLGAIVLFTSGAYGIAPLPWIVLVYLLLAAVLLVRTLAGRPGAASTWWFWIDAAALSVVCHVLAQQAPWLGIITVLPVVAMSLLAGPVHAIALAVASAASLLFGGGWHWSEGQLPWSVPVLVLGFAPAAALLAWPRREQRERLQLLDAFNQQSDPRQGLGHHVAVLLALLHRQFRLRSAVISLQGPEPRIFQYTGEDGTHLLDEPVAGLWRARRVALPDDLGCICQGDTAFGVRLEPFNGARVPVGESAHAALLDIGPESIALPLMSYGKPLGHLCITRSEPPFGVADLQWLHDLMRESMPLLERSDLLEQLQRETAARERERIGRDLHDSAVQPYLGLKYGLEALARRAAADNPLSPSIHQLVQLTTQELQTLRDVVSGLRKGQDPMQSTTFLAALHRQVERFEALYGLKVHIFAPDALQLRGSAAKAVLHMVNEALTNVRRHTEATAVTVLLDVGHDNVVVRLRNDHGAGGRDPVADVDAFVPRSLNERALEFGGDVIVSRESNFTEIKITLPVLGALA